MCVIIKHKVLGCMVVSMIKLLNIAVCAAIIRENIMHKVSLDVGFEGCSGLAIEKGAQYFKKGTKIVVEGRVEKTGYSSLFAQSVTRQGPFPVV